METEKKEETRESLFKWWVPNQMARMRQENYHVVRELDNIRDLKQTDKQVQINMWIEPGIQKFLILTTYNIT